MSKFRLEDLPEHMRAKVLAQVRGLPSEEPKKKSPRQKSVLVKAPIFCSRCGSYEHREPDCQHARMVSTSFNPTTGINKVEAVTDIGIVSFAVPVRTANEQNGPHGFWAVKNRKRDLVKAALREGWKAAGISLRPRYRVTVTRISATRVDAQNLDSFLKSPIDQIALCMGVNDGGPIIEWVRRQEIGKNFAVRCEIEELP